MVCLQTMKGLDDYSRYVVGWKLCGNMRAEDVTDTLDIALAASGCDSAKVLHKPRLLSDNVLYAELSANLASGHCRVGQSRHV
jgi:putative transposase